mgnify:CR=1 FL=1
MSRIPGAVQKAVKSSARKTLQSARREAVSKVKARYTSPTSIFTGSLSVKSSASGGAIKSTGSRNPLEKFKATPSGRITQRGRYIKAEVVRGQGGTLPKAFRKSSGASVFERLGANRFPIKKLKSVGAPSMLNVPQVREPVMQKIETEFPKHFLSAVSQML